MRLLQVDTLSFKEIPKPDDEHCYAILSHTWGDQEVSFQEFSVGNCADKAGYMKIKQCCEQAKLDGLEYVWVDTCCIDKTSSSELSEAINSMYQWYKQATVCHIYLADIQWQDQAALREWKSDERAFRKEKPDGMYLGESRWFTRGWTLQELIAPRYAILYDRDWVEVGTKDSMRDELSAITGIPREVLADVDRDSLGSFCIAQRMSWASTRLTTRDEDVAYCLMGIFDVNMPILYGEGGRKAFNRLQHEIMKSSDDHSLFAWVSNPEAFASVDTFSVYPILARHPDNFTIYRKTKRRLVHVKSGGGDELLSPYSFTNKGLHISLPLIRIKPAHNEPRCLKDYDLEDAVFVALLNCEYLGSPGFVGICLGRHSSGKYVRIHHSPIHESWEEFGWVPLQSHGVRELYIDDSTQIRKAYGGYDSKPPFWMQVTLLQENCRILEFANNSYKAPIGTGELSYSAFAVLVTIDGIDSIDTKAVVVVFGQYLGISCAIYPASTSRCPRTLEHFIARYMDEFNVTSPDFLSTDRATATCSGVARIAVAVRPRKNIGKGKICCVIIKCTVPTPLSIYPPKRLRRTPSDTKQQRLNNYGLEEQQHSPPGYSWGDGYIYNHDIAAIASDGKLILGSGSKKDKATKCICGNNEKPIAILEDDANDGTGGGNDDLISGSEPLEDSVSDCAHSAV
ncbi:hypothetical protein CVT26_005064 [Gymnopilus dilepis]|uniref:Uncharacterized protein n=1 Tax=Gymnopilus dilepis TaxID=231916 RepID=A0A409Y098_9AGAR|nr:hypothetical protein CVT26_005064 [Gymnopilus dilepis]